MSGGDSRRNGVPQTKRYDRAYFDRWYRSPAAVVSQDVVARKARLAVAVAEHLLGRDVRTVLDIGCGEGQWRGPLKRARPTLRYTGVDSSEYAVRRFGQRRNLRLGSLGELDRLRLAKQYDLIICADVIQYVPMPELRRGLRAIAAILSGVAYIEAFSIEDDMRGDFEQWHHRPAARYRLEFERAGLLPCGLHCYLPRRLSRLAGALERFEA